MGWHALLLNSANDNRNTHLLGFKVAGENLEDELKTTQINGNYFLLQVAGKKILEEGSPVQAL